MNLEQSMVAEFMTAADQSVSDAPRIPSETQAFLGVSLIAEELEELRMAAYVHKDIVAMADAIGDLIYVTLWLANAAGIPVEDCFHEIHRSNMSKFIDGYKDPNTGKWHKGPSWTPPNLVPILTKRIIQAS